LSKSPRQMSLGLMRHGIHGLFNAIIIFKIRKSCKGQVMTLSAYKMIGCTGGGIVKSH
jgi:hypothetical protein